MTALVERTGETAFLGMLTPGGDVQYLDKVVSPKVVRRELQVMGTDYPTPDGTAVRDYVHLTDLADAHVRALRHLEGEGRSGALNLCTGRGHSVREVIAMVERVSGRKVNARNAPRRAGDPPALVAAPGRARELLGWEPRWSSLETIVQTAYRWHSAHVPGAEQRAAA